MKWVNIEIGKTNEINRGGKECLGQEKDIKPLTHKGYDK